MPFRVKVSVVCFSFLKEVDNLLFSRDFSFYKSKSSIDTVL